MIDMTGLRFGRLIVECRNGKAKGGQAMWLCKCDCGNMKSIAGYHLRNGFTRSCGCLMRETSARVNRKHGMSGTATHTTWVRMRRRCYDKNWDKYKWYGGRGIKVCKRWEKFENFYKDMGERPKGMTLDRKNSDKDYCKSNCRWASWRTQQNNRRNNHKVTLKGRTQTIAQWSREIGISQQTLLARINRLEWSVERALTEPLNEM